MQTLLQQTTDQAAHFPARSNSPRHTRIHHQRISRKAACPLRVRCLSKSSAWRRYLSVQTGDQPTNRMDEMKAKIDSEACKRVYARRLAIVEPVFANICIHKRMNRFILHTKQKVNVQ
ncbi:MAG: transposase [Chloroflexota bacterium]